jgi:hypothetical protein
MDFETEQSIHPANAARLFTAKLQARAEHFNARPCTLYRVVDGSDGAAAVRFGLTNSPGAAQLLPESISHDSVSSIHSTFTLVADALNIRKTKVLAFG